MSSEINERSYKSGSENTRTRKHSSTTKEFGARQFTSTELKKPANRPTRDDDCEIDSSSSQQEIELPPPEVNDNSNSSVSSVNARKMLIQYGRELVCLFALALTTYATFQNGPPKMSRAPKPVPLFAKSSLVQEWPSGQLNVIHNKALTSELSLVLFYAPWCAESQFAKNAYEAVANSFYREVYFAAVNCWQPGGECRLQYAKVQSWPVLMAYYPQGIAVQYSGPWLTQPLSKFIRGLMQPYKRISNKNDLYSMQVDSNSVVVGFFNSEQLQQREFHVFVQSAIKWLEKDPYQDVKFAIVTGESYRNFDVSLTPVIKIYNWNETLELGSTIKWTTENITRWVKDHLNMISTWIHPPGRKSMTLAPYLKAGPTVLFFTPVSSQDGYHMLKQIALEYYKKSKNNSQNAETDWNFIYSIRKENSEQYLKLKTKCSKIIESQIEQEERDYEKCNYDEPNIAFVNILNTSKYDKYNEDKDSYCYVGPKLNGLSCKRLFNQKWRSDVNVEKGIPSFRITMLRPELDSKSALRLLENSALNLCRSLSSTDNTFGNIYFKNIAHEDLDMSEFTTKAREFNRTLSFILLDSLMYAPIAERLGVDIATMPKKSAITIVDNENDSTYQMNGEISTNAIINFLKNFLSGSANRKLRSAKRITRLDLKKSLMSIKEINSSEFREYIKDSLKTVVVLFYSVQCALCSLLSQSLLLVARILEAVDIDFVRIDADNNDFRWHYTMDTYPTVVIFPRNRTSESRVFPRSLEVNVPNILGFVIANLNAEERLQALFESCQFKRISNAIRSCSYALRKEISDIISLNLHKLRNHHNQRTDIIRKLEILQRIYLLSFQMDTVKDSELIRNEFKQIRKK